VSLRAFRHLDENAFERFLDSREYALLQSFAAKDAHIEAQLETHSMLGSPSSVTEDETKDDLM